jgi:hypothetical protein
MLLPDSPDIDKMIFELDRMTTARSDMVVKVLNEMDQLGFLLDQVAVNSKVSFVIFSNTRFLYLLRRYGFAIIAYTQDTRVYYVDRGLGYLLKSMGEVTITEPCPFIKTISSKPTIGEGYDDYEKYYTKALTYGGGDNEFPLDFVIDRAEVDKIFELYSNKNIRNNMFGSKAHLDRPCSEPSEMISSVQFASGLLWKDYDILSEGMSSQECVQRLVSGIRFSGCNLTVPNDYLFRRGLTYKYIKDYNAKNDGQMKLLLSDLAFCHRYGVNTPLVIGGAPGEHWEFTKLQGINPILVDPREVLVKGFKHKSLIVKSTEDILDIAEEHYFDSIIWDVRASLPDDDVDEGIERDLNLIVDVLFSLSNLFPMSIKFRFPKNKGIYSEGIFIPNFRCIRPQGWRRMHSYESRLEIGPGGSSSFVQRADYEGWNTWINTTIAHKGMRPIIDALVNNSVAFDYVVPDVSGVLPKHNFVSNLFSMPGNFLSYDDQIAEIKRRDEVVMINSSGLWCRDCNINVQGNVLSFGKWKDKIYDIYRIQESLGDSYCCFTLRDYICMSQFKGTKTNLLSIRGPPSNLNSAISKLYVIFIKTKHVETVMDINTQNFLNAQTHLVKMITPILRKDRDLDNMSLHYWRLYAMMKKYPDSVVYDDVRVTGMIKGKLVAIAGHPLNILIASRWHAVDCHRYWRTIRNNVEAWRSNDFSSEIDMLRTGTNAEHARFGLWHNWLEYSLAVETYKVMIQHGLFGGSLAVKIFDDYLTQDWIKSVTTNSQVAEERFTEKGGVLPLWTKNKEETLELAMQQVNKTYIWAV